MCVLTGVLHGSLRGRPCRACMGQRLSVVVDIVVDVVVVGVLQGMLCESHCRRDPPISYPMASTQATAKSLWLWWIRFSAPSPHGQTAKCHYLLEHIAILPMYVILFACAWQCVYVCVWCGCVRVVYCACGGCVSVCVFGRDREFKRGRRGEKEKKQVKKALCDIYKLVSVGYRIFIICCYSAM